MGCHHSQIHSHDGHPLKYHTTKHHHHNNSGKRSKKIHPNIIISSAMMTYSPSNLDQEDTLPIHQSGSIITPRRHSNQSPTTENNNNNNNHHHHQHRHHHHDNTTVAPPGVISPSTKSPSQSPYKNRYESPSLIGQSKPTTVTNLIRRGSNGFRRLSQFGSNLFTSFQKHISKDQYDDSNSEYSYSISVKSNRPTSIRVSQRSTGSTSHRSTNRQLSFASADNSSSTPKSINNKQQNSSFSSSSIRTKSSTPDSPTLPSLSLSIPPPASLYLPPLSPKGNNNNNNNNRNHVELEIIPNDDKGTISYKISTPGSPQGRKQRQLPPQLTSVTILCELSQKLNAFSPVPSYCNTPVHASSPRNGNGENGSNGRLRNSFINKLEHAVSSCGPRQEMIEEKDDENSNKKEEDVNIDIPLMTLCAPSIESIDGFIIPTAISPPSTQSSPVTNVNVAKMCYLCNKSFRTVEEYKQHKIYSKLHFLAVEEHKKHRQREECLRELYQSAA